MSLKTLGSAWLDDTSLSLVIAKKKIETATSTEAEAKVKAIAPFFPNQGSQSNLFFEVLGFKRGKETQEANLSPVQIENVNKILTHHGWKLPHPDVLVPKKTLYSVDFKSGFKPKSRRILVTDGNGNGKTAGAAAFCYAMTVMYPWCEGLIIANTYDQLKGATIRGYVNFYLQHNIPFSPWTGDISGTVRSILSRKEMVINGCTHQVRSADSFDGSTQGGRGIHASHACVDEGLRLPDATLVQTLSTRMRMKGIPAILLLTSTVNTTNPFNWGHEMWVDEETRRPGYVTITGSSVENLHRLSTTYIEDMYADLTHELFRIEVLGEYVATTEGKVFKYFNRTTHLKPLAWVANASKFISVDFNWNPACAIVGQINNNTMEVVKEFYLPQSDTFILSEAIAAYLIQHGITDIAVFGDASGVQHTANSQKTNWQIVFEQMKKSNIKARSGIPTANPSIIDSVNAINVAFMQSKTFIDPSCKELIKDYESLEWRGSQLDKRDGARSHLQDCHRYAIWQVYPLLRPSPVAQGNYRT